MSAEYVAIITDGNGRWAQQRDLPVVEGHSAGADTVKARLRDAAEFGIKELTVYSFSTENWSRPDEEVEGLMAMFAERIDSETPELNEEGVRMRFIGRREGVSDDLQEKMDWAEAETAANDRITLFVAFNYGGRAEILDAAARVRGRGRGGVPQGPLRARDARPRPADPHQRRAADLQLPALAVRLLGVRLLATSSGPTSPARRSSARSRSTRSASGASGLAEAMTPLDDIDPPTFQFGPRGPEAPQGARGGRRPRPRSPGPEPAERGVDEELEIPSFDEPVPGTPDQPGEDKARSGPIWQRLPFAKGETAQRVIVAIPWIVFAITIVAVGGELFMLSMIGLAVLGLRELFRMTAAYAPVEIPAYLAVAAMIVAAHYGTAFNIVLAFARALPA